MNPTNKLNTNLLVNYFSNKVSREIIEEDVEKQGFIYIKSRDDSYNQYNDEKNEIKKNT